MTWPAIKKAYTIPELKSRIDGLVFSAFKPSLIVWHNTGLPTFQQWEKSYEEDLAKGLEPGITRINSLENFFKNQQGWNGGPHAFVFKDKVWEFSAFNTKGTHSPSWNGISIGIEMIADFSIEDDETGIGAQIKSKTIILTAMLCEKLGLNPETAIKLHKEDKATTHDCPGLHIARDKEKMIMSVLEYMGHGGEHVSDLPISPPKPRIGTVNVPVNDSLNLREKSSASSQIIVKLQPEAKVTILNSAMNGNTKWLLITVGSFKGWVSEKFIKEI